MAIKFLVRDIHPFRQIVNLCSTCSGWCGLANIFSLVPRFNLNILISFNETKHQVNMALDWCSIQQKLCLEGYCKSIVLLNIMQPKSTNHMMRVFTVELRCKYKRYSNLIETFMSMKCRKTASTQILKMTALSFISTAGLCSMGVALSSNWWNNVNASKLGKSE